MGGIITAVAIWTAIIGLIVLLQTGFGKAKDAAENAYLRREYNKDGGDQISAQEWKESGNLLKAYEKGLITEEQFDAKVAELDEKHKDS